MGLLEALLISATPDMKGRGSQVKAMLHSRPFLMEQSPVQVPGPHGAVPVDERLAHGVVAT